ncbi:aminoglycoside phosphotransferase family protein [Arthrobacter sp. R4-81]
MHIGQHHVDDSIARRLIRHQFPEWSKLPVKPVVGSGTVHAIFQIGSTLVARFPLVGSDPVETRLILEREAAASVEMATASVYPTPTPLAIGSPGDGYPLPWSVQTWLPGETATPRTSGNNPAFAGDLVTLINGFRSADTKGRLFSGSGRGGQLTDHDDWMEKCFRESESLFDVNRFRGLWSELRELPSSGSDVMSHMDLIPANLLVRDGRLSGVLDGGGFGPADPALDLVAGWHLLDERPRNKFRESLGCDDTEWGRGMAWALVQAMGLVWYYRQTNPTMSELGRSTLSRIMSAWEPMRTVRPSTC